MNTIWRLVNALIITFGTAYAGSIVTMPAINSWYQTLEKPFFTPPNWIFGPVWTILYFLMGISLFLIWNTNVPEHKKKPAIYLFFAQLLMNFLWSVAFFSLKQPLLGLIVIFVLWGLIQKTITYFFPIKPLAAYLLYPYLAWVTFAGILNFAIAVLNF